MKHRLLLCLLVALPCAARADIYRWTDAQGRVHYAQTPPPDGDYRKVDPRVSAGGDDAAVLHEYVEAQRKTREAAEAEKAKLEAKAQEKAGACVQAQARLKKLEEYGPNRLVSQNDKGEVERWTTEKWDAERAAGRKAVDENCAATR